MDEGWDKPFHPDDKQPAWDAWNHATETGETYRIESRLRAADGSYRWFLMRGLPVRDATGRIVKWFGTCTDIDELKRAEEQLRSASQYARSLLEASLDPLVTISADGKITDVNHGTELITGRRREHLIGTDFAIYFTVPEKARAGYRRVFAKGFLIDYSLAIRHVAGTVTDVLCNASLYYGASGSVEGVFFAARDISRLPPADLAPTSRRRWKLWHYAGYAAAAIVFLDRGCRGTRGIAQLAGTTPGAVQHPPIDGDQFAYAVVAFGGEPDAGTSPCCNGAIAAGNRPRA